MKTVIYLSCSLPPFSLPPSFSFPHSLSPKSPNCRPTALSWPFDSKWMYVGTDNGNIHMVHVENFAISGYCIYWNDAIDR